MKQKTPQYVYRAGAVNVVIHIMKTKNKEKITFYCGNWNYRENLVSGTTYGTRCQECLDKFTKK